MRYGAITILALLVPDFALAQAVAATRPDFDKVASNIVKSAELVPEADYGFKPVATVRSFGQLFGHLANENFDFCAAVLGEKSPNTTDFEKVTSKAQMVAGLKAAMAYCGRAYAMPDANAHQETTLFNQKMSKLRVLVLNAVHNGEHYGNLITYLRIKGMVPPSSQGG